jgi:hypothetical protein
MSRPGRKKARRNEPQRKLPYDLERDAETKQLNAEHQRLLEEQRQLKEELRRGRAALEFICWLHEARARGIISRETGLKLMIAVLAAVEDIVPDAGMLRAFVEKQLHDLRFV